MKIGQLIELQKLNATLQTYEERTKELKTMRESKENETDLKTFAGLDSASQSKEKETSPYWDILTHEPNKMLWKNKVRTKSRMMEDRDRRIVQLENLSKTNTNEKETKSNDLKSDREYSPYSSLEPLTNEVLMRATDQPDAIIELRKAQMFEKSRIKKTLKQKPFEFNNISRMSFKPDDKVMQSRRSNNLSKLSFDATGPVVQTNRGRVSPLEKADFSMIHNQIRKTVLSPVGRYDNPILRRTTDFTVFRATSNPKSRASMMQAQQMRCQTQVGGQKPQLPKL